MPTNPTVSEVRELLVTAEHAHSDVKISIKAELLAFLCRHFLASQQPMTAGEFAGRVSREIGERESFYLKYDDAFAKGVVAAMEHSRIEIDKLCREHNITIVEPKKC